jgi:hypothetical protein
MTQVLLAGALDHLMRYRLTGCRRSGRHAAHLQLPGQPDPDDDTRCLCGRVSEALEAVRAPRGEANHV